MANDFHHKLKLNRKAYRSSCSHITHKVSNSFETATNPQTHSVSFHDHLQSIALSDSTETPLCSDNEDSDYDDENMLNGEPKRWYMAFPDDTTSTHSIHNAQSVPNVEDNNVDQNDRAKTLYSVHLQRNLHQLYSEGEGGGIEGSESAINNEEGITMMGYTHNNSLYLYSEGDITAMDADDEDNGYKVEQLQEGITLMGIEPMTIDMDDDDEGNINEDILMDKEEVNITLMGHFNQENKENTNGEKAVITLMGKAKENDPVSFIVYSMH